MNPTHDDIVQRASFLRFLSAENYQRVRALLREEQFEFGENIVRQGEPADALYILVSGRARVLKTSEKGEELALASLRPGDEFGERALLDDTQLRGATVRCSTAVVVLRLSRSDMEPLFERHPELRDALEETARHRTLHGFLYEFSNFGRLPARALRELIDHMRPVSFAKGEVIIREGDPAGPMFVVEHGRARAFTARDGTERNLAFYRESDFFGELSILNGSPRAASVVAVTDCRLLALAQQAVEELQQRYPEFRHLLEERLAQYQARTEARVPLDFTTEMLPAEVEAQQHLLDTDSEEEDVLARAGGARRRRIRRFPHVPQVDEMDCGAACLAMICRHYGRKVSLSHIRQLCHTSLDGTSLKGICHAANELGLSARALKVSQRNLPHLPLPAIVHWEGNHWVVLYHVGKDHVWVADPGSTCRRIPRAEFEAKWSGYSALFDYTDAFEQAPLAPPMLRRFAPFVTRHGKAILQAVVLAVVVTLLELLFPVFTQVVVDKVIVEGDVGLLNTVLIALAAVLVFSQLAKLVQQYLLAFTAVRIDAGILDLLTRQMLSLPMSYFHSRRTGDIQRRLDGAQQVRSFIVQDGIGALLALVTLLGTLPVMFLYSPLLLGVFLISVPLYFGLMIWSRRVLRPLFADIEESQGKYASHQIDAIKGIEAVKASAAEQTFRDAMLNEFLSVARKMFRSNFVIMVYEGVLESIGHVTTILFLYFGALQVMNGNLTVGGFVAFAALTGIAYGAIQSTLGIWDQWQQVSVLLNRLGDIFEPEPEQGHDRSSLVPVSSLEGHIELRNVGFRYGGPEAPSILSSLDLVIPHGRMVAIVGRSGSGKTTLIKLLAGLVEPTEGSILFDRMDLRRLNYRDVRRQIGMVLQDNHIFSGSITRNIAFGDSEPDFDRVLWCAQVANAHDFIMRLPMGYETKVGETGIWAPGGQKQRIAIARALYNDPPILIFDEATSALDTESERAIQTNLGRMMAGRTSIVIAHRLSTVRDADLIVVLEQGRIAEQGTHDELMALRGLYFHLSSQQLGGLIRIMSQTNQTGSRDLLQPDDDMLPHGPPPIVVSASAWLIIGLFVCATVAALVVRLPETLRYPFVLVPTERADPVRAPYFSVVREVRVSEGHVVAPGDELFVLVSETIRAKHTQRRMLQEDLQARIEGTVRAEAAHEAVLRMKAVEISRAQRELEFRKRHLEANQELVERGSKLANERIIAQLEWIHIELDLAESEKELRVAELHLDSIQLDLERVRSERIRIHREEQAAIENLRSQIAALDRDLEHTTDDLLSIRAPYHAVVLSVASGAAGDVVEAGQELSQLARIDALPRVRLSLDEAGLPLLAEGQRVQLFDAFPYQRYGTVDARLDWISPATVASAGGQQFAAIATLNESTIRVGGKPRSLSVGMKGEARVHTGSRLLVEYALEPLRQVRENLRQ